MKNKKILNDKEVEIVCKILMDKYPSKPDLEFKNSFELLIATILSAQCTDKRVNIVTKELFKILKKPEDIYKIELNELEDYIKPCGLYKNKAISIYETCDKLVKKFNSKVPNNMENLLELKGVGRKVANVVLSNAFNIPAIAVDTHVFRVSNQIGLVDEKNVYDTEMALMKRIPKENWIHLHHALIKYGREVCTARVHKSEICPIREYCLCCKEIIRKEDKVNK